MSSGHGMLCLGAMILAISCGGGGTRDAATTPASNAGAPAGGASAGGKATGGGRLFGAEVVAGCGGFGASDAAAVLGVAPGDVVDQSANITPTLRGCTFARKDKASQTISFTLQREDSIDEAAASYAQMKGNIPIADQAQRKAGAGSGDEALIEISGLGDEALWTSVNGSLTVRRGNLTILVMSPADRPTQIKVAQKVIERLR